MDFDIGQTVWVKGEGRKGIVKRYDEHGRYVVTYFDRVGVRRTKHLNGKNLEEFKPKSVELTI